MSNKSTTLNPSDSDDRVEIARIELKRLGKSFADLARELEVNSSTISLVLRGHKSARLEPLIAAAIGWQPKALFPKHYDAAGNRIARTRNGKADITPVASAATVKKRAA